MNHNNNCISWSTNQLAIHYHSFVAIIRICRRSSYKEHFPGIGTINVTNHWNNTSLQILHAFIFPRRMIRKRTGKCYVPIPLKKPGTDRPSATNSRVQNIVTVSFRWNYVFFCFTHTSNVVIVPEFRIGVWFEEKRNEIKESRKTLQSCACVIVCNHALYSKIPFYVPLFQVLVPPDAGTNSILYPTTGPTSCSRESWTLSAWINREYAFS